MKTRSAANEQLDNLSLQGEPLYKALKSLNWINRWFGNKASSCKAIVAIYRKEKKPLHIIDLGCGGGDLALGMAGALQKNNTPFSITGIDGNSHTLNYAQKKSAGFNEIYFMQADILSQQFKTVPCDVLFSSHFIYHFTEDGLVHFLKNNLPSVSSAVVFSELERSRLAAFLFRWVSFLLPISKMARQDGQLAIKRSFTRKEWLYILEKAGVQAFSLKRMPFFRIRLIIFQPANIKCL